MAEANFKGSYNNSCSDDCDKEYEGNGFNFGFIFGNVDNSGDLDADYLDQDAKEHLSALADKLGSSLPDYGRKAEDAVDYEDIDEEYEESDIQLVTEEDHLLPRQKYFLSEVAMAGLNDRATVFDEEDYDEEEEEEERE